VGSSLNQHPIQTEALAPTFVIPTGAKRSGGTCGSLNQHPIRTEATTLTFVIPTEPRISYYAAPPTTTYAAFVAESRMKFAEPTKLDRKSGGSGGICSSLNQHPIRTEATALTFVIPSFFAQPIKSQPPTEVEGTCGFSDLSSGPKRPPDYSAGNPHDS
jgi:hypothetical protein